MISAPRLAVLALLLASAGCAAIPLDNAERFEINTTPSGAQVTTSNGYGCDTTPCFIRMPRDEAFTVTVEKPGYEPYVVAVELKDADWAKASGAPSEITIFGLAITKEPSKPILTARMFDPNPITLDLTSTTNDAPPSLLRRDPVPRVAPERRF